MHGRYLDSSIPGMLPNLLHGEARVRVDVQQVGNEVANGRRDPLGYSVAPREDLLVQHGRVA
eukprot:11968593-Prorocentrum_lima.AAC.1